MKEYIMRYENEVLQLLPDKMQELIRCKDCKHGHHIVNSINGNITLYRVFCTKPYVERGNATHEPDWFCADGERKTE